MTSRKLFSVLAALCVLNAVFVSARSTSITEDDVQEVKHAHTVAKRTTQDLGSATKVFTGTGLGAAGIATAGLLTAAIADTSIPKNCYGEDQELDQHSGKDLARVLGNLVFTVGSTVAATLLLSGLGTKALSMIAKRSEQNRAAELDEKMEILESVAHKISSETN
eukprot:GHVT01066868.1.p1 GENE.GHVT01066868.1~~GHVT01066868.1.p1  ORF type:complete len:165 (-),score=15.38 GHVT01066868.1:638-1132(-)